MGFNQKLKDLENISYIVLYLKVIYISVRESLIRFSFDRKVTFEINPLITSSELNDTK